MDTTDMRSLVLRDGVPGKICSRCGEWKPLDAFNRKLRFVHSQCKACQKQVRDAGPKPDKRAYYAEYRRTHQEKIRAYREENRERFRIYVTKYKKRHPEKWMAMHRKANQAWAERNVQKKSEENRRWRKQNPDKALQKDHRRRARERQASGIFTQAEWEALKRSYGNICLCCGLPEGEVKLVPDHVLPLAKGGSNYITNIQPLCERCNKRKSARETDYRVQYRREE